MHHRLILAGLLMLAHPAVLRAQWAVARDPAPTTSAPRAPVDAARRAAAEALVDILAGRDRVEAQAELTLQLMTEAAFAGDPELAGLAAEYPGIETVFADSIRSTTVARLDRAYPVYREDLIAMFAARMSAAHLEEASAFFGSPVGKTLIGNAQDRLTLDAVGNEMVAHIGKGDNAAGFSMSAEAMAKDRRAAAVRGVLALTPAEREIAERFALSAAGLSFAGLNAEKQAINLRFANTAPTAEMERDMEARVIAEIANFIANEDARRAAQ